MFFKPSGTMAYGFGGHFEAFDADKKYAENEEAGMRSGAETNLPYIMSKHHTSAPPLEPSLAKFLKYVWKPGVVNKQAPQQQLIAQHRPVPENVPTYLRAINPTFVDVGDPTFTQPHLEGLARDWTQMLKIERVVAYTFRGDGRGPEKIEKAGGFQPPCTRTDDYYLKAPDGAVFKQFKAYMEQSPLLKGHIPDNLPEVYNSALAKSMSPDAMHLFKEYSLWRGLAKREEMHLGRMLAQECLKGYISTTKSLKIAKGFNSNDGGWIYCVLVRGGYVVPERNQHEWTTMFGEAEIAYPGAITWNDVWGFRQTLRRKFVPDGPVYLRKGFFNSDEKAAEKVYKLLSGKNQKSAEEG